MLSDAFLNILFSHCTRVLDRQTCKLFLLGSRHSRFGVVMVLSVALFRRCAGPRILAGDHVMMASPQLPMSLSQTASVASVDWTRSKHTHTTRHRRGERMGTTGQKRVLPSPSHEGAAKSGLGAAPTAPSVAAGAPSDAHFKPQWLSVHVRWFPAFPHSCHEGRQIPFRQSRQLPMCLGGSLRWARQLFLSGRPS